MVFSIRKVEVRKDSVIMRRSLLVLVLLVSAISFGSAAGPAPITYIPADKVAAAFAKGMPLLEVEGYKIHASRREAPGMAEVHVRDTDLIYVLDGSAEIILGGDVVSGKTIATDEIRGASIQGGETRKLVKGDVLVVPNAVPHWFKSVNAPFLYYVVKVAGPPAGGTR